MNSRIHEHSEGQSLVLIALLMVAMIAFLGLLIDGGAVMMNRRNSQNASDAAAFAGVRALANRSNDNSIASLNSIWITMTNIAAANGITTTDVAASLIDKDGNDICGMTQDCINRYNGVPALSTGVRVTTTLRLQPYFISVVIGKAAIPTKSVAAAQSGVAQVATFLDPMTVPFPCTPYDPNNATSCSYFTPGTPFLLVGDKTGAGGFQWLTFDCQPDTNDLEDYLQLKKSGGDVLADTPNTYYNPSNPTQYNTPPPSPNPWICGSPGISPSSGARAALDCWLDFSNWPCNHTGWGPKPASSVWTVPIFNVDNGLSGNNFMYHTVLFADFQLLGYKFGGGQCNWLGAGSSNPQCSKAPALLQSCAKDCIMGEFLGLSIPSQIKPGQCNTSSLDLCGYSLSQ